MKLYLLIPVYKGGRFWQECWQSVVENLDFFERVFVSFNFSELQKDDLALVENASAEIRKKVSWLVQTEPLSAVDHATRINSWVKDFLPDTGFLFNLCHDDILNRKGLEELVRLNLTESSAVFGSFHFFDEDRKKNDIIFRLFRRESGKPFAIDDFTDILYRHQCSVSISGLLVPTAVFKKSIPRMDAMFYGWGAEHVRLLNPWISSVTQTYEPLVHVREHSGSEGALVDKFRYKVICDIMYASTLAFLAVRRPAAKMEIVRSIGYTLRRNPVSGIAAWLRVQFTFMRLGLFPASLKVLPYLYTQISGRITMALRRFIP